MTWELAKVIILDALKDSALVFAFVFLFHLILSLFEDKMAKLLTQKRYIGPVFGSIFGIIPQCGTSVLAADLYIKKYITLGTIVAVFLSCSDEALILLLTHPSEKTIMVLPLVGIKIVIGMAVGLLIDLVYKKQEIVEHEEEFEDVTCEEHHHEHVKIHKYLIHPLIHSLEIFAYVLIINIALGLIIGAVGEENFSNFIVSNRYLSPLFSSLIGLIPNCVSSVLLSELFIDGHLAFGALVAGLLVNSGLGIMVLLKNKKSLKSAFIILGICFAVAIIVGYVTCLISGF